MNDGRVVFTGSVGGGGGGGGVAPVTTAVAADVADAEPAELVAVTVTRSVSPTSPEPSAYEAAVAPETDPQLPPDVSQRAH